LRGHWGYRAVIGEPGRGDEQVRGDVHLLFIRTEHRCSKTERPEGVPPSNASSLCWT